MSSFSPPYVLCQVWRTRKEKIDHSILKHLHLYEYHCSLAYCRVILCLEVENLPIRIKPSKEAIEKDKNFSNFCPSSWTKCLSTVSATSAQTCEWTPVSVNIPQWSRPFAKTNPLFTAVAKSVKHSTGCLLSEKIHSHFLSKSIIEIQAGLWRLHHWL